jgi:uncharacterized membrane protein
MGLLGDVLNSTVSVVPNSGINPSGSIGGTGTFNTGLRAINANYPQTFIFNITIILIWALGIVAVVSFIWGGVKYITAGGDSEKAESGKKVIIGSAIGLLIIMSSYIVFNTAVTVLSQNGTLSNPNEVQQVYDRNYQ